MDIVILFLPCPSIYERLLRRFQKIKINIVYQDETIHNIIPIIIKICLKF